MEVLDLDIGKLDETVSLDMPSSSGVGLELLMNDKQKSISVGNSHLGELDTLENELNELSGNTPSGPSMSNTVDDNNAKLFGISTDVPKTLSFDNLELEKDSGIANLNPTINATDSKLGEATSSTLGGFAKTWDGFMKSSDTPNKEPVYVEKTMTERERRRKKRAMLKKLEEWHEKGLLKSSSQFDLDSNYEEIEDEYETAMEDKRKKDSIKLQGWWFMTVINSIEYGNSLFNPFDLNLDGWGEQVSEDLDSYEEIFGELHEKYKGGKMAPELSLLLRVGFSAAVLNFSNKALASATPAFNDVIKQSPELMKMFTNATVDSMSQESPGFAMANQFMQDNTRPKGPPPPASVETKNAPPPPRPGMTYTSSSNRPDINSGRGSNPMFKEDGISLDKAAPVESQEKSLRSSRPEMKGPQNSDIDNILSGLKTRNVNIHTQNNATSSNPPSKQVNVNEKRNNDSLLSVNSLKEMDIPNMPKSSKRKNNSAKNVMSLDI